MPNRRTSKNISHRAKRRKAQLVQKTEEHIRYRAEERIWIEKIAAAFGVPVEFVEDLSRETELSRVQLITTLVERLFG